MTSSDSAITKTSHLGLPNSCGVNSAGRPSFAMGKFSTISNIVPRTSLYLILKVLNLSPLLLIGDLNQVELFADKLGGTDFIRGQTDFITWKINNGLTEVPFFGPRFTWMNNQYNGNFIMERLDRAYANQQWFTLFPSSSLLHLPILVSDHAPIILSICPDSKSRKRPYRIDNWCLSYPEVRDMVLQAWKTPFFGSSMYVRSRKLSTVRFAILQWVINHRISHGINWSEIEADLDLNATHITDETSASSFMHLRSSRLQMLRNKRHYWVQRSKFRTEVLDGFPTRFLYSRVKKRATKHRIMALRSADGVWLESPESITNEIVSYFKNLLCSNNLHGPPSPVASLHSCLNGLALPKLRLVECSLLEAPFSETDILHALQGMDASKSPGPDGITPKFFQTFWPEIGHLVTSALLRFLNSGVMLKEWNNTIIVLIPKTDKPELVSQFRPISLCNVIYRLASKCMANRLKLVIPSLISDSQQAFVPDRLMSDGCLIAHEIMHYINKTKKGTNCYSVIKLDMHKAFDRVSWHFLMSVLDLFGFPMSWRNLIWECISTFYLANYKQLSPVITLLDSRFLGMLRLFRTFFYVDDAFICCKATPASFEAIRDIFQTFETASGQMINLQKSFIKFSPNSPEDFKSHMTSILRMNTSDSFDKVTTCISSWSSLHLSQASKFVIINSILLGSLVHILAAVPLPLSVSRKIDFLIAAFWWSKNSSRRSIHWLSQPHLHIPRDTGGLGIKSVTILGQAYLLKNFWRLHHRPAGLLAKYLTPKYQKDLPIPDLKSKVTQPSFVWQGICKVAANCSAALAWKIGNGNSVSLLSSPWVQGKSPGVRHDHHNTSPTLSDLVHENGSWKKSVIFQLFDNQTAKAILAMEPPLIAADDYLYWKYTEDGCYNIRSGYTYLLSQRSTTLPQLNFFPWKLIWQFPFSSKFPIFIWRIAHQIIPTMTILAHRGSHLDTSCPLCRSQLETPEHLFRSCEVIQHIWRSSSLGIQSMADPTVSFTRWLADHISYLNRSSSTDFSCLLYFFCIFRSIWLTRNSIVFEDHTLEPERILHLAEALHLSHTRLPSPRLDNVPSRHFYRTTGNVISTFTFSSPYKISVCRSSFQNGYMATVSTESCLPEIYYLRAMSSFAAYSQARLQLMTTREFPTSTGVTFAVTSRKLCSVLVSQRPVPIVARNSLREIRRLLRLHRNWSGSNLKVDSKITSISAVIGHTGTPERRDNDGKQTHVRVSCRKSEKS
ncbi:uncharacterized protein LOC141649964 [Silene latifolia]|uniref:uncharacterized protein LOC141649964 n=1 Tax=Silene latifolia TaxID=37657 RepID=UPI003D788E82